MADKKSSSRRLVKKVETVRQKAEKVGGTSSKQRRLRQTASSAVKPLKAARRIGAKTYFLPLPDNGFWGFMNSPRSLFPRFFRDAFRELKLVTWPTRKETWKLTSAVFVFAITFGVVIAITDYGLEKLFKAIVLK